MSPADDTVSADSADGDGRVLTSLDEAVRRLRGAPRPGQVEMAARVADALETRTHLLVQAGTGTGKSLGYLVPVMVRAVDAGERAVVSTATLALQRQILTRDAPLAADAVEVVTGSRPGVALLKGWQNYVCRHRLEGGYPDDEGALFSAGEATTAGSRSSGCASGRRTPPPATVMISSRASRTGPGRRCRCPGPSAWALPARCARSASPSSPAPLRPRPMSS